MISPKWLAALTLLLLLVAALIRLSRRQSLARFRAAWGAPIARERRMDAMAASHAARIAARGGRSLDARTWADLNLDDVFAAIDRTHGTLGRQALYHRLRTTQVADRLGPFEVEALLTATSAAKSHIVLAATHDRELVDLAADTFDAYHFGDSVGTDGLIFDHRLQRGPSTTRNAIALLRLHGAPETLLARAVATAEKLDRQNRRDLAVTPDAFHF